MDTEKRKLQPKLKSLGKRRTILVRTEFKNKNKPSLVSGFTPIKLINPALTALIMTEFWLASTLNSRLSFSTMTWSMMISLNFSVLHFRFKLISKCWTNFNGGIKPGSTCTCVRFTLFDLAVKREVRGFLARDWMSAWPDFLPFHDKCTVLLDPL